MRSMSSDIQPIRFVGSVIPIHLESLLPPPPVGRSYYGQDARFGVRPCAETEGAQQCA